MNRYTQLAMKIVVLLSIIAVTTQATLVEHVYNEVEPGDNVTGTIRSQHTTRSKLQCSDRCSRELDCTAYRYNKKTKTDNCVLIQGKTTQDEGQILDSEQDNIIYKKAVDYCSNDPCQNGGTCTSGDGAFTCACAPGFLGAACADPDDCYPSNPCQNGGACIDGNNAHTCNCTSGYSGASCQIDCSTDWCPPSGWPAGDQPALYRNFDTGTNVTLTSVITLVVGKVNRALSVAMWRWAELGVLSAACITVPGTCVTGGSFSVWLQVPQCESEGGVISALHSSGHHTGFSVGCTLTDMEYKLVVEDKTFIAQVSDKPVGWFHLVFNYISSTSIEIYHDGSSAGSNITTDFNTESYMDGNGKVVIGSKESDRNNHHAEVLIDDLVFFNRNLTLAEVSMIYNKYQ